VARGLALALAATLALTGCRDDEASPSAGDVSSSAEPSPSASEPTEPTESASPQEGVLDPAMAVERPGPRTGQVRSADLLVFAQDGFDDRLLERLARLPGVSAVEPLSLAQVTIENRAVNVAAVDPATFRNFTQFANKRTVWNRIADGELSIEPALERRTQDDYLRLGAAKDAPRVHVGTELEQLPQVDVVLNQKWGAELGMTPGNAMLISTGQASPKVVRPRIQRLVGDDVSVQRLDVAALLGLDTSALVQTAFLTGGSVAAVVGTFSYTVLEGGRIAPDPAWVSSHITTEAVPILGQMTCNKAIFPQLRAALTEIQREGLAAEIHVGEYAGCYNARFIAGSTQLSNHAFGLAYDLNVPGNQRGTVGEIDRRVVAIFERWGFGWGGRWSWTDPMHFELNALVTPR
jgi:hypothetical protein